LNKNCIIHRKVFLFTVYFSYFFKHLFSLRSLLMGVWNFTRLLLLRLIVSSCFDSKNILVLLFGRLVLYTLPAVNLAPPELSYSISYTLREKKPSNPLKFRGNIKILNPKFWKYQNLEN
jgi:hypothetical protein